MKCSQINTLTFRICSSLPMDKSIDLRILLVFVRSNQYQIFLTKDLKLEIGSKGYVSKITLVDNEVYEIDCRGNPVPTLSSIGK